MFAGLIVQYRISCRPVITPCDDGVLVFDVESGATHLLDDLAWSVLNRLLAAEGAEASGPELADEDAGVADRLDAAINALLTARLIARC